MLAAATIGMGVVILLGTVVLLVTILHRASAPPPPAAPIARVLREPAGTRIGAIAGAGGRFLLLLHGGGPDRLVLIDPRTGAVAGRIALRP